MLWACYRSLVSSLDLSQSLFWLVPQARLQALLNCFFIELFRDTPLAYICRLWHDDIFTYECVFVKRRNKKAWKETLAGKGVVSDSQVSMLWDRVVLGCFVRYRCSAKSVSLPICSLSCHTHRASQIQKHKNIFLSKNKQAALWPKHLLQDNCPQNLFSFCEYWIICWLKHIRQSHSTAADLNEPGTKCLVR